MYQFTKFSNINEDVPSYHRRYDFFVSKFSSLCHDSNANVETRRMLRVAGLNGLKGVIQKTVSDDLQVDIWDANHMEKIVPSLLYNMHDSYDPALAHSQTDGSKIDITTPSAVAEYNLRELVGKATFGNIRAVIKPVLRHLDNHDVWAQNVSRGRTSPSGEDEEFAVELFRIIMHSIQSQHSYAVIQILMGHLDDKSKASRPNSGLDSAAATKVRTGIAMVLANIVGISASESIGPTVLELINSLLDHLRTSINNSAADAHAAESERQFQETVINALGEFANNLPDYQKIEIMMFILSKVPPSTSLKETDIQLQGILLRSLLRVSTKYKTVNMVHAFPSTFLRQLLSMSLASEASVRLTVQKIFHQLLDRHGNLLKLSKPIALASFPPLSIEKAYRQDAMFMKKHGSEILVRIFEGLKFANNTGDNYDALFTTLALFCVEMSSEEVVVETLRVALSMQDLAISSAVISEQQKAALHSVTAALSHLVAQLTAIPALGSHVELIIKNRQDNGPWMIPESDRYRQAAIRRASVAPSASSSSEPPSAELLFDKQEISEALRSSGHDTTRLLLPIQPSSVGMLKNYDCTH